MPTAISAPGKVLLAGGYLVLDREYTGLVFGLDARIHVIVESVNSQSEGKRTVEVRSPQFQGAVWKYGIVKGEVGEGVRAVADEGDTSKNPFVETSLSYALTYVDFIHKNSSTSPSLQITIIADNDYYSQTSTASQKHPNSPFLDFGVSLFDAHKTGLGSSAALVTSLTTALLTHCLFKPEDLKSSATLAKVHNLAQAAHCAAQGKVGSGFDVAAAVYGSCVYRRFSPNLLSGLGEVGSKGFAERVFTVVEDILPSGEKWDTQIKQDEVQVPSGLRLIMCDVDCGSQTPGMVKQVLQWRKENPEEAGLLWGAIQKGNEELCAELRRLSQIDEEDYTNLRDIIETIRSLIREMSVKSGVPIEPKVQTELLDACAQIEGVVGGVVPGAGGFDAVALVVRNSEDVLEKVKDLVADWKSSPEAVGTGEGGIGNVRVLGVRQEMVGLKLEDVERYEGWL